MSDRRFFVRRMALLMATTVLSSVRGVALAENLRRLFTGATFDDSFNEVMAGATIMDSPQIDIDLPTIAENGAVVPITLRMDLDDVERIYLWAEKNPTPLIAVFDVTPDVAPYITTRVKLAESGRVVVLVKQGEQWFKAVRQIDVTQGGCGTG